MDRTSDPEYGSQGASRIPPAAKEKYGKMFDAYKNSTFLAWSIPTLIACSSYVRFHDSLVSEPFSGRWRLVTTRIPPTCDNQTVAFDTIYPMTKHMLEAKCGAHIVYLG